MILRAFQKKKTESGPRTQIKATEREHQEIDRTTKRNAILK